MKVVISNFSQPIEKKIDFKSFWAGHSMPPKKERLTLFEQPFDWGFHLYSLGVYMMDQGMADEVEFWDYSDRRATWYHSNGILKVFFYNSEDVLGYLERYGYPDLIINHGRFGQTILPLLEGKCFRVHVPVMCAEDYKQGQVNAECFLVDSVDEVNDRAMLYIPVVNTSRIFPLPCEKKRDFIYLASLLTSKRHDLLIRAVRGTSLTGHFHPVDKDMLDLEGTHITTSSLNKEDVVELLRTSRIAVYPGDKTSNPAAMWECVAAGLPVVVNEKIRGGRHLVVSGITGEFAREDNFYDVMQHVLTHIDSYQPAKYFQEHWNTVNILKNYISFFRRMGFNKYS
jgi:glycosyltransferase involved in cell wall biosynthesis